jgi:uncharacterized protein YbcI
MDRSERDGLARELCNRIALALRDYTGRGPTRTQVFIQRDVITCILRGSLTKGEQRMVDEGLEEAVLRMRRSYQDAMSDELTAIVEELTGRSVIAFLSDNHVRPDVAIEAFILEVAPGAGPLHDDAADDHGPGG